MKLPRVVITGGEGDLAKALSLRLEKAGFLVDALGKDRLDVTNPAQVKECFAELGDIDLLICNAGVTADGSLARMSEDSWDQVMEVNLKGSFLCACEATKMMMKRRLGHIIFISSYSALHPPVGQANYAASKAALHGMMKSMAAELGSRNIRVNAVMPGFLETKMTKGLAPDVVEKVLNKHTLGRFNTADSVAHFILCLHQQMPNTSGQVFNLDSRILP